MDCAVYYKLRITLDQDVYDESNAQKNDRLGPRVCNSMVRALEEKGHVDGKLTSAYEYKGKTGDYTKPHFHIHFRSRSKKEAVRKAILRYWMAQYDETLKGNAMWSLVIEPYVVEDKLFGYLFKHQDVENPPLTIGFSKDEITAMIKASKMINAVATDVAQRKKIRKEENDTLYDRLEVALDKGEGTIGEILDFYMKENKPINDTTIVGYYNLYRLKRQRITTAEYADKLKSKYGI